MSSYNWYRRGSSGYSRHLVYHVQVRSGSLQLSYFEQMSVLFAYSHIKSVMELIG